MVDSKVVSLRIPTELLEAVDRLAEINYPSRHSGAKPNRSQLILDALTAYVNTPSDTVNNVVNIGNTVSDAVDVPLPEDWRQAVLEMIESRTAYIVDNVNKDVEELRRQVKELEAELGKSAA